MACKACVRRRDRRRSSAVAPQLLRRQMFDNPDHRSIKAASIKIMSTGFGFALLRMNDRLKPFMYGPLTQRELVDAVLSVNI